MKKIKFSIVLAVIASLLLATGALALFTNGNFEAGDFSGWTQETFLNPGLTTGPGKPPFTGADIVRNPGGSNQSIMTGPFAARSQTDPYSPILYPAAGSYTARINGPTNGQISNTIKQTSVVTAGDVDASDGLIHLRFIYAAVMQDPGHAADDQPWFYVKVTNDTKATTLYDKFSYAGDTNPWLPGTVAGWE